jgi:elongation factor P
MPTGTNIRKGQILVHEGDLWVVLDTDHRTQGNKRGYMQVVMKHLKTGRKDNHRFRSTDKVEFAFIETRELQFLYRDPVGLHFMDTATYEQMAMDPDLAEEAARYLKEGDLVSVRFHEESPVGIDLPTVVELEVTETEPGLKGDSVSNVFKLATLETGLVLKVPNFINQGEMVRVDTRTGEFAERAQPR